MDLESEARVSLAFGRFRVLPHRRELLSDGRPAKLGGHAFDVLIALIEARGAIVSKCVRRSLRLGSFEAPRAVPAAKAERPVSDPKAAAGRRAHRG